METAQKNSDILPRTHASGIPVYCAYDEIVPIGELRPNPKNPNKHPQDQLEKLGKIIRGNGWRNPITVSTRSGLIVKGHGRMMAAELEEFKEVPVEFQNYESDEAELADLTADNRIAELAEMDTKMLADIFADIDTGAIDFELSGYTEKEYEKLATALSDAVCDEQEDQEPEINQPTEPVTKHGDVWILGDDEQVKIEVGASCVFGTNGTVTFEVGDDLSDDMLPMIVDSMVMAYIRSTGSTNVKCIRNGEKLQREAIADIFNE